MSDLQKELIWIDNMASWQDPPSYDQREQAKQWLTEFSTLTGEAWHPPDLINGNHCTGVNIEWFHGPLKKLSVIVDEEIWYMHVIHANEMHDGDASLPGFLDVWKQFREESSK